jgi:hypothetical protein
VPGKTFNTANCRRLLKSKNDPSETQQRNVSLNRLAMIAKRIVSIRQLHEECGDGPPPGEIGRQFSVLWRGAELQAWSAINR